MGACLVVICCRVLEVFASITRQSHLNKLLGDLFRVRGTNFKQHALCGKVMVPINGRAS